jgi:hypothetical protein
MLKMALFICAYGSVNKLKCFIFLAVIFYYGFLAILGASNGIKKQ